MDNQTHLDVHGPCDAFVRESAPRETPELRKSLNGWELVVSFTPAPNQEANAIRQASARGEVDLVLHPTLASVRALRLENGYLVLAVASESHARQVKRLLCLD